VPTQQADLVGVGFGVEVAGDHRREPGVDVGGDEPAQGRDLLAADR